MATSFHLAATPLTWQDTENWLEQFNFFIMANDISGAKVKATFFACCEPKANEFIKTAIKPLSLSDELVVFGTPTEGQTDITTTLRTCLKPKVILHYERYKLAMCRQNDSNIQDFVADLKRFCK